MEGVDELLTLSSRSLVALGALVSIVVQPVAATGHVQPPSAANAHAFVSRAMTGGGATVYQVDRPDEWGTHYNDPVTERGQQRLSVEFQERGPILRRQLVDRSGA